MRAVAGMACFYKGQEPLTLTLSRKRERGLFGRLGSLGKSVCREHNAPALSAVEGGGG